MKTIGLIGAGHIGSQLARLAVAHGYKAVVSNSRGPETLAHMKLFKEITPETVKASQVSASSIPEAAKSVAADAGAGLRSIWDTIKSFVSK